MKREEVKCKDCGFMALRGWADRQLKEAGLHFRESGEEERVEGEPLYDGLPVCFAQKARLDKEILGLGGGNFYIHHLMRVIGRHRICDGFTEWLQGFTPKEHMELLDRKQWRLWQTKESRMNRNTRIIEIVLLVIGAPAMVTLFSYLASFFDDSSHLQLFISGNVTSL